MIIRLWLVLLTSLFTYSCSTKAVEEKSSDVKKIEAVKGYISALEINEDISFYNFITSNLELMKLKIVEVKLLSAKWALVQSDEDDLDKKRLRTLLNEEVPFIINEIDSLFSYDPLDMKEDWNEVKKNCIVLFENCETIMSFLHSIDSYNHIKYEREIAVKAQPAGELAIQIDVILGLLENLSTHFNTTSKALQIQMNEEFEKTNSLIKDSKN